MNKKIFALGLGAIGLLAAPLAFAHVVVKPAQAGVGSYQTFTMGVPSEKPVATTGMKLVMPSGLSDVTPNVKPGWKIEIKKDAATAEVTELDWSGGSVPSGERDEFSFSAKVPAEETTLSWKAYQTYSDGSTVSWDMTPSATMADDDSAATGPYSTTMIVNDLAPAAKKNSGSSDAFSIAALAIAIVALVQNRKRKA